jgi:hypothetical protein
VHFERTILGKGIAPLQTFECYKQLIFLSLDRSLSVSRRFLSVMSASGDLQAARDGFRLSAKQPTPKLGASHRKQFEFLGALHSKSRQEIEQCRLVLYHRVQDASTSAGPRQVSMQKCLL